MLTDDERWELSESVVGKPKYRESYEDVKILRQRLQTAIKQFIEDRSSLKFFRDKVAEWEDEELYARGEVDRLYKIVANLTGEKREQYEWVIEGALKQRELCHKEIERFKRYYLVCLGKIDHDPLDIPKAKEVPIGDIMPGTPQRKIGNRWTYLCPFHQEKTPSFIWYRDGNRGYCFGCGFSGDAIQVIVKLHKCTFIEAVKLLLRT